MVEKPGAMVGLRHLALWVKHFDESLHFYHTLLGMAVVWQPDADNIYLSSGTDNLALHRAPEGFVAAPMQQLDHIGFALGSLDAVDEWYAYCCAHDVKIKASPRTHRDGTRSFYCNDPDGNTVQMIYLKISE